MNRIFKYCLVIFGTCLSGVSTSQELGAEEVSSNFIGPKLVGDHPNLLSLFPGSEYSMARSGRVMVSVMVDKEGKTYEPMIEYANNHRYDKAALKVVAARAYSPATQNGVPVESWVRYPARFDFTYDSRSLYVSTDRFNKHYNNFNAEIAKEKPSQKKLQKYLNKLAGTKHGGSLAFKFLSLARYKYQVLYGSNDDQIDAIREMMLSGDNFMALAKGQIADKELIRLLIESNYLGEALVAYDEAMRKHGAKMRDSINEVVGAAIADVRDIIESDKAFARKISLNEEGYAYLPLVKELFTIDQIQGNIEKFKVRCTEKFKELKFVADADYKIPKKWGECQLQIIGEKGTQARMIAL